MDQRHYPRAMPNRTRFRLQELLDEKGVTQRELSSRAGLSPTTVNRMCKNLTAQVSLATLDAIADALRCEPTDVLTRSSERRRR